MLSGHTSHTKLQLFWVLIKKWIVTTVFVCFVVFAEFCIGATVIDTNWRIAIAMCSMCSMCSRVKPKTEPNNQLLQKYQLFLLFFLSSVFIFLFNTISAIFCSNKSNLCYKFNQAKINYKKTIAVYVWYFQCLCECECSDRCYDRQSFILGSYRFRRRSNSSNLF